MVRQLGVVAVVAALGVLQVQDGRALDREGRPLPLGGQGLLAEFRPGRLDGPLDRHRHRDLRAGRGLGLPLALVPARRAALGGGAGEGADPGRGAEEGGGRGRRLAGPLLPSASWTLESRMLGDMMPGSGQGGGSFLSIFGDSCSFLGAGFGNALTDPYRGFSNISGLVSCGSSGGKGSPTLFATSLGLEREKEDAQGRNTDRE